MADESVLSAIAIENRNYNRSRAAGYVTRSKNHGTFVLVLGLVRWCIIVHHHALHHCGSLFSSFLVLLDDSDDHPPLLRIPQWRTKCNTAVGGQVELTCSDEIPPELIESLTGKYRETLIVHRRIFAGCCSYPSCSGNKADPKNWCTQKLDPRWHITAAMLTSCSTEMPGFPTRDPLQSLLP